MEMIVENFWRKSLRAMGKTLLVAGCLAVILFMWVTISFNRAQPSHYERSEGIVLAKELDKSFDYGNEVIFARASRGSVTVFIYGISNTSEQNRILEKLKELLKIYPFNGKVNLKYFPAREYSTRSENGYQIKDLVEKADIREEQL